MLDKIFADRFHNIRFSDLPLLRISLRDLPDGSFYSCLYAEIARRGLTVPNEEKIIINKKDTAKIIADICKRDLRLAPSKLSVLSSGAGLGIVESYLRESGFNVTGIEFHKDPKFWHPEVEHLTSLDLLGSRQFDIAIEVSTFYTMDDQKLAQHVSTLASKVRECGILIIYEQDSKSVLGSVYGFVKSMVMDLLPTRRWKSTSLWGYLRTPDQLLKIVKSNAKHTESRYFRLGDDWSIIEMPAPVRFCGRQLFRRSSLSQMHVFRRD